MFNNLIGKNKELGRFLFCERYTLPPVKNAMYIAEGQDLKRGAVVDVNGVLVGTNSLMPYAVLEFDCDTRSGGKEASVFIKGEFNFDKLHFAEGLEKSDLDNIVYNGSGIGIVIKPYAFDKEFSPKSNDDGGYKQVNLTFATSDTKTIPVGQKEEVHVNCSFKNSDDVVFQFAEDCTDAVVILTRVNSATPRTFKTMRGSTVLPLYGANLITDVNPEYIEDKERFLLTSHYEEGEHGGGGWSIPRDFDEIELNDNNVVGDVVPSNIKDELLGYKVRSNYLIVAKGSIVMCLPGD